MATSTYIQKHNLAQTIERALAEALKSQPDNPWNALAAWFNDIPAAPASASGSAATATPTVVATAEPADCQPFETLHADGQALRATVHDSAARATGETPRIVGPESDATVEREHHWRPEELIVHADSQALRPAVHDSAARAAGESPRIVDPESDASVEREHHWRPEELIVQQEMLTHLLVEEAVDAAGRAEIEGKLRRVKRQLDRAVLHND